MRTRATGAGWLASALAVLKRVLGMPDYAAYLAHHRARHPDCPVLTQREYYDQYVRSRYGAGASRCC
jgi:uncharacterized short protein YbdD (DUF466 family)